MTIDRDMSVSKLKDLDDTLTMYHSVSPGSLYLQQTGRKNKLTESVGKIVNWLTSHHLTNRKKERKKEKRKNKERIKEKKKKKEIKQQ